MLASLFCFALASVVRAADSDFDDVEIQAIEVDEGVAMLVGRGGNIGVCYGRDGILLIDDQFAPLSEKIRAAVATLHDGDVRFVLNTHWHGDHTGGNRELALAGATIVAHDNVRRRLAAESYSAFFDRTTPPAPREALPIVTYGEDVTFHVNDRTLHVVHVAPAHTDGDSIVVFDGGKVIHTGDVYFNGRYPYIDLDASGDPNGVIAAVDRVLEIADDATRIIPGHGPLSNRAELATYRAMMVAIRDRVQAAIDQGKSLEEVIALAPTREYDERWGGGFLGPDRFTTLIYRALSRKP